MIDRVNTVTLHQCKYDCLQINYSMYQYKKYRINSSDSFKADDFPKVITELTDLNSALTNLSGIYKKEIVLSFLKKHSLDNDWITANPELTGLISSGTFTTGHMESLFESSHSNNQFQQQYENFILERLS